MDRPHPQLKRLMLFKVGSSYHAVGWPSVTETQRGGWYRAATKKWESSFIYQSLRTWADLHPCHISSMFFTLVFLRNMPWPIKSWRTGLALQVISGVPLDELGLEFCFWIYIISYLQFCGLCSSKGMSPTSSGEENLSKNICVLSHRN